MNEWKKTNIVTMKRRNLTRGGKKRKRKRGNNSRTIKFNMRNKRFDGGNKAEKREFGPINNNYTANMEGHKSWIRFLIRGSHWDSSCGRSCPIILSKTCISGPFNYYTQNSIKPVPGQCSSSATGLWTITTSIPFYYPRNCRNIQLLTSMGVAI